MSDSFPTQAVTEALLAWFRARQRDLPWRRTRDPYAIWVAETMLQQTQVSTVIPYYERFLERFPTVRSLAEADLDAVLALWQGLGYYARARHLHAAAREVMTRYGGRLPPEYKALRALPGIGEYTAAALMSIAFDQDYAVIDGNVRRALCRLFDYAADPTTAEGKRALQAFSEALLPKGQAGPYNQAMMELGATLCLPREPLCSDCPVQPYCLARQRGVERERPVQRARIARRERTFIAAYIARGDRLLLLRRRPEGLLGGLWELPNTELGPGEGDAEALQRLLQELSLGVSEIGEALGTIRHAYSHFTALVRLYRCATLGEASPAGLWDAAAWLSADERAGYGLTGVTRKALENKRNISEYEENF